MIKLRDELAGVELGHQRRNRRAQDLLEALGQAPEASLPQVFAGQPGELDAAYDFLENPAVSAQALGQAHAACTVQRLAGQRRARVIYDTTEFLFTGKRDGLGWLNRQARGFLAHMALAVASGPESVPLGLLHRHTWQRRRPARRPRGQAKRRCRAHETERRRWAAAVNAVAAQLAPLRGQVQAIQIADRESDIYGALRQLQRSGFDFIVRGQHDRAVHVRHAGPRKLRAALAQSPVRLTRLVPLPARAKNPLPGRAKSHPPRAARLATLQAGAAAVWLRRPPRVKASAVPEAELPCAVVWVREVNPPPGAEPVEWWLYTSLPVATPEQIAFVVEEYAARWTIEEYFKVLKTGCAMEARQLESYAALTRLLALLSIVAWMMLRLVRQSRETPDAPAAELLGAEAAAVLQQIAPPPAFTADPAAAPAATPAVPAAVPAAPARPRLTLAQAVMALALLGGYLPRKAPPGWIIVWRGWREWRGALRLWRRAHSPPVLFPPNV